MLIPSFAATTRRRRTDSGERRMLTVCFSADPAGFWGTIGSDSIRSYVRCRVYQEPVTGEAPQVRCRPYPRSTTPLIMLHPDQDHVAIASVRDREIALSRSREVEAP